MESKCYKVTEYEKIVEDLLKGNVVGFPTDTVYGLAIVYDDVKAFNKLYQIKNRSILKPISMIIILALTFLNHKNIMMKFKILC